MIPSHAALAERVACGLGVAPQDSRNPGGRSSRSVKPFARSRHLRLLKRCHLTKALLAALLALATTAAAEQVIPVSQSVTPAIHELRLHNGSPFDAATVTFEYESVGHSAASVAPIRMEPGGEIILSDVVRELFGLTPDAIGEIHVQAVDSVDVQWRQRLVGSFGGAWLPSVTAVGNATSSTRRRSVICSGCNTPPRVEPPPSPATLVKPGDFATFTGSHGVSGTATIIDPKTIRVSSFKHDGSAPGLDLRVGLSTKTRANFAVIRIIGRQSFQAVTFDLTLPEPLDLNSFDVFTVWCYEFRSIIGEGKFQRP